MQAVEIAYEEGWRSGYGDRSAPYSNPHPNNSDLWVAWRQGFIDAQEANNPQIGYVALKSIKYKLHETFDVIKSNPMDLNLLMEHIARLTSSVATISEYLAGNESDHDHPAVE